MQTSLGGLIRANVIPRAMVLRIIVGVYDITVLGAMLLYKAHAVKYPDYGMTVDEFVLLMKQKG